MSGTTSKHPFGFIKLAKPPSGYALKNGKLDFTNISLHLYVLPLNFTEFLTLMNSLDEYTQYNSGLQSQDEYRKLKWKHKFDTYKEILPAYYNDYMNTCLRFVDSKLKATGQHA